MQFSRFVSFFMAFVAVGLVAAVPTEMEKRSTASNVMTVLTTLQTKTSTIIPKISMSPVVLIAFPISHKVNSLIDAAGTNQAAMEAPLNELMTALTTAQNGVAASGGLLGGLGLTKRQTADEIAVVFAGVTSVSDQ